MLSFLIVLVLVVGVNTAIWGFAGLCRLLSSRLRKPREMPHGDRLTVDDVAVLIAAHNEELVIAATIQSALSLVPAGHVFVASDGSVDRTVKIARRHGAKVMKLNPNRGKAGALAAAIDHFELARNFKVVLLLDADTRLDSEYMATGLPLFDDPNVVAVAGRAATIAYPESPTWIGRFLVAYRERFYVAVQYLLKYGQAARSANVVSIVPGFASMYRSRVLRYIDICPPGLAIEDFNMTFEIHAKRLGRIAFHPKAAIAYTQDPDNYGDYTRQLHRWTLGFWQTLRRHGFRTGRFGGALALYVFELLSSSIVLLLAFPLLLLSVGASVWVELTAVPLDPNLWIVEAVPPLAIGLGILLPDYVLTIVAVIVTRRPKYLYLGLAFPIMRMVDAAICLRTLPQAYLRAFVGRSNGIWKSPTRRPGARADSTSQEAAAS